MFSNSRFPEKQKEKAHLVWVFSIDTDGVSRASLLGFCSASTLHQRLLIQFRTS